MFTHIGCDSIPVPGTIVMEPKPARWDAHTTCALFRDSEGNVILIASQ